MVLVVSECRSWTFQSGYSRMWGTKMFLLKSLSKAITEGWCQCSGVSSDVSSDISSDVSSDVSSGVSSYELWTIVHRVPWTIIHDGQ